MTSNFYLEIWQIHWYFLLKKCEWHLHCKRYSHFCSKNISVSENTLAFDLGFAVLSRTFHLYWAKGGRKPENQGKNHLTIPKQNLIWLSHIWPERGSNHRGEKPNGLRVNSPIHQATGAYQNILATTVNKFAINKFVKLTMLWITGPRWTENQTPILHLLAFTGVTKIQHCKN